MPAAYSTRPIPRILPAIVPVALPSSPIDRYRAAILEAEDAAEERFNVGDDDEADIADDLATAEEGAYALFEGAALEMENLINATPTAAKLDAMMTNASAPVRHLLR